MMSWNGFLQSPAISYVSPLSSDVTSDRHWRLDLLEEWRHLNPEDGDDGSVGCDLMGGGRDEEEEGGGGVENINFGSYIILAALISKILCQRLSLAVRDPTLCDDAGNGCTGGVVRKVGIAIPEGPFLPLFILAIHSLNSALGEDWICVDSSSSAEEEDDDDERRSDVTMVRGKFERRRCDGVALVPLETDEAPDRLRHMLADAKPDLILVDMERSALWNIEVKSIESSQLVNFVELVEEAISSYHSSMQSQTHDGVSLLERLWPPEIRNDTLDSIRYPQQAVPGSFDVPRLVALGLVRLSYPSFNLINAILPKRSDRHIVSHVVYTSGTTGVPKGCVSSLASLRHYVRTKNVAHSIDHTSRALLTSAITFDPCLSDVLATCVANAVLCLATRERMYGHGYEGLTGVLRQLEVTHVLCTPSVWSNVDVDDPPTNFPSLQVVALGGEPIPKAMVRRWARTQLKDGTWTRMYPRLCATYGVTEACVYQTFGEVVLVDEEKASSVNLPGQSVGLPLLGANIFIDSTEVRNDVMVMDNADLPGPRIGEVVLSGAQVDALSSYLNSAVLTSRVFVKCIDDGGCLGVKGTYFYRTGDLGCIDPMTGNLHVLGRIQGCGMVKFNGIRIELSEIENACIDYASDEGGSLVIDCMAAVSCSGTCVDSVYQNKQLVAYCLLSSTSLSELGISAEELKSGVIVPPGPLRSLLRVRCDRRVRKGCTPSFFVLIDQLPLSPTGKRCRSSLPPLSACSIMSSSANGSARKSLWECGKVGSILANKICECLNLQPCQRQLVTLDANFFVLGGDSLAATRVVRGLHALHHGIMDSRNLGGSTGMLDGPFAAKYLLKSETLGAYLVFLVSKAAFQTSDDPITAIDGDEIVMNTTSDSNANDIVLDPLYESLLVSITLGYAQVAYSLLDLGVDPNMRVGQGRLGKISDRVQQRILFKSTPLHLACLRGNPHLVKKLLEKGCKVNIPDASGSFPIHLACSRIESKFDEADEDLNR